MGRCGGNGNGSVNTSGVAIFGYSLIISFWRSVMDKLRATIELVDDKVTFQGSTRNNTTVKMDYFPPVGNGEGYTGLELLLVSLAGCSATSVVSMLRKMKAEITAFHVEAEGDRVETHPTVLSKIRLHFSVTSPNATQEQVIKAIQLSEETYCPVWAMLKGTCEISSTWSLQAQKEDIV